MRRIGRLAGGAAVFLASCRTPTQITLVVRTDVPCDKLGSVTIATGALEAIERDLPQAETNACGGGRVGTLVVVPSSSRDATVGVKVVLGVSKSASACVAPDYKGCIVARRSLRFVQHEPLLLPIDLRLDCLDIPCGPGQTCVNGKCRDAEVPRPGDCVQEDDCIDLKFPPPTTTTGTPPALTGGTPWTGWTRLGSSQDPGIYAADSRANDFDLYYSSFVLPAGAVATLANSGDPLATMSTGAFRAGDTIVGVGIGWKSGQRGAIATGVNFLRFDRNGTGAFSASTSVAPAAGNGVVAEDTSGGTGMTQFSDVGYRTTYSWTMRYPTAAGGGLYNPVPGDMFLNTATGVIWGVSYPAFKENLPIRVYRVIDAGGVVSAMWLVDSSAFDRAGTAYSEPYQSFEASRGAGGFSFALAVNSVANGQTQVVGLRLPLFAKK